MVCFSVSRCHQDCSLPPIYLLCLLKWYFILKLQYSSGHQMALSYYLSYRLPHFLPMKQGGFLSWNSKQESQFTLTVLK